MLRLVPLVLLLLTLARSSFAEPRHQIGAAASGRSLNAETVLQSIIGQPSVGSSQGFVSGFIVPVFKPPHLAGDANGDGLISISDVVYLISYIFAGGPPPPNLAAADADCSGVVNISDAVYLIAYIFAGGPIPAHC